MWRNGHAPVPDLLGPDEFLFNQVQIFDQDSLEPMDVFSHAALDEGGVYDIEIGPGGDVYVAVSLSEGHGQIVQFTYEGEYLRTITLPDERQAILTPMVSTYLPTAACWSRNLITSGF